MNLPFIVLSRFFYCVVVLFLTLSNAVCIGKSSGQVFSARSFQVSSSREMMMDERYVFDGGTCNGYNISPYVSWEKISSSKSYAITMFDPDESTGSGWWHWIVYDIPSSIGYMQEGLGQAGEQFLAFGFGKQAKNDFGFYGYGGPCPQMGSGLHSYIFTVYALNVVELPVGKNPTSASVRLAIMKHVIAKTSFYGYYER